MRELEFGSFLFRIVTLVLVWKLALQSYYGDKNQNAGFFQITCFNERKNMVVE